MKLSWKTCSPRAPYGLTRHTNSYTPLKSKPSSKRWSSWSSQKSLTNITSSSLSSISAGNSRLCWLVFITIWSRRWTSISGIHRATTVLICLFQSKERWQIQSYCSISSSLPRLKLVSTAIAPRMATPPASETNVLAAESSNGRQTTCYQRWVTLNLTSFIWRQ